MGSTSSLAARSALLYSTDIGEATPRSLNAVLMLPSSGSSSVKQSEGLRFTVDVPSDVTQADIENSIVVQAIDGAIVKGNFSWTGTIVEQYILRSTITFTPLAGFSSDADYKVTIRPAGTFSPIAGLGKGVKPDADGSFTAILSTGSKLRVVSVTLWTKDGNTLSSIGVKFSEPARLQSLLKALSIRSESTLVSTEVVDPLPQFDTLANPTKEIKLNIMTSVPLKDDVTLTITGATTVTGSALMPFGSKLALSETFNTTSMRSIGDGGWEWAPSTVSK